MFCGSVKNKNLCWVFIAMVGVFFTSAGYAKLSEECQSVVNGMTIPQEISLIKFHRDFVMENEGVTPAFGLMNLSQQEGKSNVRVLQTVYEAEWKAHDQKGFFAELSGIKSGRVLASAFIREAEEQSIGSGLDLERTGAEVAQLVQHSDRVKFRSCTAAERHHIIDSVIRTSYHAFEEYEGLDTILNNVKALFETSKDYILNGVAPSENARQQRLRDNDAIAKAIVMTYTLHSDYLYSVMNSKAQDEPAYKNIVSEAISHICAIFSESRCWTQTKITKLLRDTAEIKSKSDVYDILYREYFTYVPQQLVGDKFGKQKVPGERQADPIPTESTHQVMEKATKSGDSLDIRSTKPLTYPLEERGQGVFIDPPRSMPGKMPASSYDKTPQFFSANFSGEEWQCGFTDDYCPSPFSRVGHEHQDPYRSMQRIQQHTRIPERLISERYPEGGQLTPLTLWQNPVVFAAETTGATIALGVVLWKLLGTLRLMFRV